MYYTFNNFFAGIKYNFCNKKILYIKNFQIIFLFFTINNHILFIRNPYKSQDTKYS